MTPVPPCGLLISCFESFFLFYERACVCSCTVVSVFLLIIVVCGSKALFHCIVSILWRRHFFVLGFCWDWWVKHSSTSSYVVTKRTCRSYSLLYFMRVCLYCRILGFSKTTSFRKLFWHLFPNVICSILFLISHFIRPASLMLSVPLKYETIFQWYWQCIS